MNKQPTTDLDRDQFLDKLEAYPKEVVDMLIAGMIAPQQRFYILEALQRIEVAWETNALMEEHSDLMNTINHLESKKGNQPVEKIKQLRKRADGLQAAITEIGLSQKPNPSTNKKEDAGPAETYPTSPFNDTDA